MATYTCLLSRYAAGPALKAVTTPCVMIRRPTLLLPTRGPAMHVHSRQASSGSYSSNAFVRYLKRLKWVPIPLGVGFAYISYQQLGHVVKREKGKIQSAVSPADVAASEWQISLYRKMPLKSISRLWGRFNSLDLPVWLRQPAFKLYIWMFNCDLSEAAIQDLKYYRNLGEFFRRQLRPNVRPVDEQNQVVSPSDGKVLHFGRVQGGSLEQIKGMNYSLEGFLGPASWLAQANLTNQNAVGEITENVEEKSLSSSNENVSRAGSSKGEEIYEKQLQIHPDNALYHCVIYLAPGDYHRFHSPTEWKMTYRRHFPGELFSVNPGIARWIQGLFNFNERAIYMGEWEHGFFSLAAVGATNVGSIRVYCDKELSTNTRNKHSEGTFFDAPLSQGTGIAMKRGENLGEFNLGSTIVLVFEAPKSFQFKIESGQKIKYGEPLGDHEV